MLGLFIVLLLAGCSGECVTATGAGLAALVNEANAAANTIKPKIKEAYEKAEELDVLVESGLLNVVGVVNPELKAEIDRFIINLQELKEEAEVFKDEKGKFDYDQIYRAIMYLLTGGVVTSVAKKKMDKKP
jgi:hypothetical protein